MTRTVAIARKWGNSIGIAIPEDTVKKEKIKPNDRVVLEIKKIEGIKNLFGTWHTKKTAQQIKDEARKGWD